MIAVMPQMRLLVAVEPVDFRNGIDGLVAVCRQKLSSDPMSGAVSFGSAGWAKNWLVFELFRS